MKHLTKFFVAICGALLLFAGCQAVSDLDSKVADLETRVSKLETLCSEMNTNISSLQTIVSALQQNDYVTSVAAISGGYTINFSKSGSITIYDGAKGDKGDKGDQGDAGATPVIGVAQGTDGLYYWTLNGDWLLDGAGNKILAQGINGQDGAPGKDGQDGVPPQLRSEEGNWYVSVDSGATWTLLGQATGDKGDQGDAMFKSVTYDDDFVYFTLADDTLLTCPRKAAEFTITFAECGELVENGQEFEVEYTLSYGDEKTTVEAISNHNWEAEVVPTDATHGVIKITPVYVSDPSDTQLRAKIVVIAFDGTDKTITKTLVFEDKILVVADYWLEIYGEEQEVSTEIETNLGYTIEFWENGNAATPADWIELVPDTKAVRTDKLTFKVAENNTGASRTAAVLLMNEDGTDYYAFFWIEQSPAKWKELGKGRFAETLWSGFLYFDAFTNYEVDVYGLYFGDEFQNQYKIMNPYAAEPFLGSEYIGEGDYGIVIYVDNDGNAWTDDAQAVGLEYWDYDLAFYNLDGTFADGKISFSGVMYYGAMQNGSYAGRFGTADAQITVWLPDYEPVLEEHLSENYIIYDDVVYNVVKMKDGKWWMARNLAYIPVGRGISATDFSTDTGIWYPCVTSGDKDVAPSTDASVIAAQGYFYSAAVAFGSSSLSFKGDETLAENRGICPAGWHIPTVDDMTDLVGKCNNTAKTNDGAPYYNTTDKTANLADLNADGINILPYQYVSAAPAYGNRVLNITGVEDYHNMASMWYAWGSTGYNKTAGNDATQVYGFMVSNVAKTTTIVAGFLNLTFGASVRCVRND